MAAAVVHVRSQVAAADAVVIASPEYAHGVTGAIKNALDWLVGFEPFAGKAVAVINLAPRARQAEAALRDTVTTMAAAIVAPASLTITLPASGMDAAAMAASAVVAAQIGAMFGGLRQAADEHAANEQSAAEPSANEPSADEPSADEQAAHEQSADEQAANEQSADEQTTSERTAHGQAPAAAAQARWSDAP